MLSIKQQNLIFIGLNLKAIFPFHFSKNHFFKVWLHLDKLLLSILSTGLAYLEGVRKLK